MSFILSNLFDMIVDDDEYYYLYSLIYIIKKYKKNY